VPPNFGYPRGKPLRQAGRIPVGAEAPQALARTLKDLVNTVAFKSRSSLDLRASLPMTRAEEEKFAGPEASLEDAAPESRALANSLSAPSALRPDVRLEISEHADLLRSKLSAFGDTLAGRESDIFRRRLLCEEPATLGELAAQSGVTRERTRQLENQLKLRIRTYLSRELGDASADPWDGGGRGESAIGQSPR
jgi:DNA-directed RNA polymerase sigma subunit (sigma70/sigma32)